MLSISCKCHRNVSHEKALFGRKTSKNVFGKRAFGVAASISSTVTYMNQIQTNSNCL